LATGKKSEADDSSDTSPKKYRVLCRFKTGIHVRQAYVAFDT